YERGDGAHELTGPKSRCNEGYVRGNYAVHLHVWLRTDPLGVDSYSGKLCAVLQAEPGRSARQDRAADQFKISGQVIGRCDTGQRAESRQEQTVLVGVVDESELREGVSLGIVSTVRLQALNLCGCCRAAEFPQATRRAEACV